MNTNKIIAEKIAGEYAPKQTSKVEALIKLDKKVKQGPQIFALVFGIISSLILGTGMSFAMGVIGDGTPLTMAIGIAVGLVGIAGACVNNPIYKKNIQKGKDKYGSDIIRLAREIADEE